MHACVRVRMCMHVCTPPQRIWTPLGRPDWQVVGARLRNRGTGGFLNIRGGSHLRGHGNTGPPWSPANLEGEPSSEVTLRLVAH